MHILPVPVTFKLVCPCGFSSNEVQEPPFTELSPDTPRLYRDWVFAYTWADGAVHALPVVHDLDDDAKSRREASQLVYDTHGVNAQSFTLESHLSSAFVCHACRKRLAQVHIVGPGLRPPKDAVTDEDVASYFGDLETMGHVSSAMLVEQAVFSLVRCPDERLRQHIQRILSDEEYLSVEDFVFRHEPGFLEGLGRWCYTGAAMGRVAELLRACPRRSPASSVEVRFVLSARRFDDEGYLYVRELAGIPEEELAHHLPSPWWGAAGGFVFLVDGVVWSSYDQPWNRGAVRDSRFDPRRFRMPLDTLAFVQLFLRGLADQIERRPTITAMLHEMITAELTFVSADAVRMRGVDPGGSEVFPPVIVPFYELIRGLVSAAEQLLARARPLLAPDAAADQKLIAELEACLDELRRA